MVNEANNLPCFTLIWVYQDRLSVIVTPRYLYEGTFFICWLWRVRQGAATELLLSLDIIIYLHLLSLNVRLFLSTHVKMVFTSLCNIL